MLLSLLYGPFSPRYPPGFFFTGFGSTWLGSGFYDPQSFTCYQLEPRWWRQSCVTFKGWAWWKVLRSLGSALRSGLILGWLSGLGLSGVSKFPRDWPLRGFLSHYVTFLFVILLW